LPKRKKLWKTIIVILLKIKGKDLEEVVGKDKVMALAEVAVKFRETVLEKAVDKDKAMALVEVSV
jgi:hypothetical protein